MGSPRTTIKTVTLGATGSGTETQRVWDAPEGTPIRDMTLWVTTGTREYPVGNLSVDVLYGGGWNGVPFAAETTHMGGTVQHTQVIAGAAVINVLLFEDESLLPANRVSTGFPVVVELTNISAVEAVVTVIFVSETVAESR